MYHVGIDASPPPIRYRSIMNDTIDTYLIPDRRFSLCRYLADTVTAPSGPIPFGYRGASVSASVSAMADTRYQHICICRARCEQTAKLSIPPKSGNNKYQLSIERCFGIVSLARSGDGATRQRSVSATERIGNVRPAVLLDSKRLRTDTDTDTDRVPSHMLYMFGRDRRDDQYCLCLSRGLRPLHNTYEDLVLLRRDVSSDTQTYRPWTPPSRRSAR